MRWEPVELDASQEDVIRRLKVPGGWLYQVSYTETEESVAHDAPRIYRTGWHPPVFVPDAERPDLAVKLDAIVARLAPLRGDMGTVGGNMLVDVVRELALVLKDRS